MSWILEDNVMTNREIQAMGGVKYIKNIVFMTIK